MSELERQYFFLYPPRDSPVLLQPDARTANRPFIGVRLRPGKPLSFVNGWATDLKPGETDEPPDVLYGAGSFAFRDFLRSRIEEFDIFGLQFYPMEFTDSKGIRHSDFWFINVYEEQPFVDLSRSEVSTMSEPDDEGTEDEDEQRAYVIRYAFDADSMEAVPLESRLIFLPKGVWNCGLVFHERIIAILQQENATGYRAFRVSEFVAGMQH